MLCSAQHFDECKDLCEWLDGYEIKYAQELLVRSPIVEKVLPCI